MGVSLSRMLSLVSVCLFSLATLAQTSPRILITKPVDENQLTVLKGNTHPLARAQYDQGGAPADLPMNRMLLVLKRSDEREASLRNLIDNQQDKASPNYHKWLTPEAFGKQFGPSDQDMAQVTSWLQSHGFQVTQVSKGRTVIEFSGTAAQVQESFHTPIHKYSVEGESHWANATDPQIPAALTPVVAGILSLHNFLKKPHVNMIEQQIPAQYIPGSTPQFTSSTGLHALSPADYSVIYHVPGRVPGPDSTIAIVGRSNINLSDITAFHSLMQDGAQQPQIVLNGPDPGNLGGGEETEAVLDATWSGAVAPSGPVLLVVSGSTNTTDGVDLSEVYIIDNNLADVMSESFGGCEANLTSADASAISSLAQQAAAQGITYTVSTGDSGSAGCDDPNTERTASRAASVNILAATPYTVAVGGTMFNENGQDGTYWNSNNSSSLLSALSYIPEKVWNESCTGTSCGSVTPNIWAGSGGASVLFSKPAWQAGFGDGARDLPDVSLTAAGHDPYLICLSNSCVPNGQGQFFFAGVGGTSASAPAFAGIMARVDANTSSRQGLANYVLYKLAAAETYSQCNGSIPGGLQISTCVFNDVTLGNNSVPGDVDYGTPTAKYQTSVGYDLATGLGSVNVTNLLNQWSTANFNATTTTASIKPVKAVHGDPITVTVTVAANSGKPTGSVWLQGGNRTGSLVGDTTQTVFTLDNSGAASGTTHTLLGGNYPVNAHYSGDATFAPSDSAPPIMLMIQPERSITSVALLTTEQSGNFIPYTGGPYGLPIYVSGHVSGQSGYGTPTSYISFSDITSSINITLNVDRNGSAMSPSFARQLSAGSHSISAAYTGDTSFNPSQSTAVPFTIAQASTTTTVSAQPASQGAILTATVVAQGTGDVPSGSITFYSGNTSLGTAFANSLPAQNGTVQSIFTLNDTQLANGQYTISATYGGDANYLASSSSPVGLSLQPDFSLTVSGNNTIAVARGQSGTTGLTVNFNEGFTGTVAFSCSGLPSKSTCSASPVTASGTTAVLTISTTQPLNASLRQSRGSVYWAGTLGAGFAGVLLIGVPTKKRRFNVPFFSILLFAMIAAGIACGGGSSSNATLAMSSPGTPTGTYPITVTATSGALTHTALVTLIVQ